MDVNSPFFESITFKALLRFCIRSIMQLGIETSRHQGIKSDAKYDPFDATVGSLAWLLESDY
jgi:hypothetical protein